MARITRISVRKRKPDYLTGILVMIMIGFIVAAGFGFTPSWVQ